MKHLIAVLVAVAAVAAAVAVPALAATKTVKVGPRRRSARSRCRIKSGDTVRFGWTGSLAHNVVITKGPTSARTRRSPRCAPRAPCRSRFNTKGTYTIVCQIHSRA